MSGDSRQSVTQPLLSNAHEGGHNRTSSTASNTSINDYQGELHHHPSMAGPVAPPSSYQPPSSASSPIAAAASPSSSQPVSHHSSVSIQGSSAPSYGTTSGAKNDSKLTTIPPPASSNNTSSSSSSDMKVAAVSGNWSGGDDKTLFGKNDVIEEMTEEIQRGSILCWNLNKVRWLQVNILFVALPFIWTLVAVFLQNPARVVYFDGCYTDVAGRQVTLPFLECIACNGVNATNRLTPGDISLGQRTSGFGSFIVAGLSIIIIVICLLALTLQQRRTFVLLAHGVYTSKLVGRQWKIILAIFLVLLVTVGLQLTYQSSLAASISISIGEGGKCAATSAYAGKILWATFVKDNPAAPKSPDLQSQYSTLKAIAFGLLPHIGLLFKFYSLTAGQYSPLSLPLLAKDVRRMEILNKHVTHKADAKDIDEAIVALRESKPELIAELPCLHRMIYTYEFGVTWAKQEQYIQGLLQNLASHHKLLPLRTKWNDQGCC